MAIKCSQFQVAKEYIKAHKNVGLPKKPSLGSFITSVIGDGYSPKSLYTKGQVKLYSNKKFPSCKSVCVCVGGGGREKFYPV